MRMTAGVFLLLTALGGCMSMESGGRPGQGHTAHYGPSRGPATVPGMQGPYGTPVPAVGPYATNVPRDPHTAYRMMNRNVPLGMVQFTPQGMAPSGLQLAGATGPQGGGIQQAFGAPNGGIQQTLGKPFQSPPGGFVPPPGAVAALQNAQGSQMQFPAKRTQVRFMEPSGMRIQWYTRTPDGRDAYSDNPIETPGRYNFQQAAIYRLKLSRIPKRPGLELYPTLEVVPSNPKTEAFLAHSPVPVEFTDEDFDQVVNNNYVVKVIYLPDPENQEFALFGLGQISSTQLEPGADPIQEALRLGSILLVIRMGNIDQEAPNTPPLGGSPQGAGAGNAGANNPMMGRMMPPNGMQPGMPPNGMMPPNMMNGRGPQMPQMPSHGPLVANPNRPPLPAPLPGLDNDQPTAPNFVGTAPTDPATPPAPPPAPPMPSVDIPPMPPVAPVPPTPAVPNATAPIPFSAPEVPPVPLSRAKSAPGGIQQTSGQFPVVGGQ